MTALHEDSQDNKYDTNTLSYRLKYCLKLYAMNQSDLARLINVKPQVIQYLCTKNIKSSRFTFELAEALNVDYTWLSTGVGNMLQTHENIVQEHKTPLITWENLDNLTKSDYLNEKKFDCVYSSVFSNNTLVATKIEDDSMEPRFEKGTTVIFDLDDVGVHGDFVLAKINQANKWVFRELFIAQEYIALRPINSSIFKEIILQPEDKITGVLVQTICDFKRNPN